MVGAVISKFSFLPSVQALLSHAGLRAKAISGSANDSKLMNMGMFFPGRLVLFFFCMFPIYNYVFFSRCFRYKSERFHSSNIISIFGNCQPLRECVPLILGKQPCTAIAYQEHHECNKDQRRFVQCCSAKWERETWTHLSTHSCIDVQARKCTDCTDANLTVSVYIL